MKNNNFKFYNIMEQQTQILKQIDDNRNSYRIIKDELSMFDVLDRAVIKTTCIKIQKKFLFLWVTIWEHTNYFEENNIKYENENIYNENLAFDIFKLLTE